MQLAKVVGHKKECWPIKLDQNPKRKRVAAQVCFQMAGPVPTADIETLRNFFGELPVQEKRLRGEPIRFGKRAPREPIRFGKRDDFPVDEDSYRLLFL